MAYIDGFALGCNPIVWDIVWFLQDIINCLRAQSHATTYAGSMPGPVAQQIISSMSIIMGRDGTNDGMCVCVYSHWKSHVCTCVM